MARQSWLRETTKLFLRYLAVGASFIPAGLLYALAARMGWNSPLVALALLGLSFLIARSVWDALEKQSTALQRQVARPTTVTVGQVAFEMPGRRQVAIIAGAYVPSLTVFGAQESRTLVSQGHTNLAGSAKTILLPA